MAVTAPAGISALVHSHDGWPVAGAVLTVTDRGGNQVGRAGGDTVGAVATEPLPPETYTAIVTAPGFEPTARTARVPADGAAHLGTIVLARSGDAPLPQPGIWAVDPAHSTITLTARHLGISGIRGRFTEFGGHVTVGDSVERSAVHAEIKAASIDTDNPSRDAHLRSADFLDADAYPTIDYRADGLTPLGGQRWQLHGELTLHGVTQPVVLELTYLGLTADPWGGTRAGFYAATQLRREDFRIDFEERLLSGVAQVGTTIRVEIDVQAVLEETLPRDAPTSS